MPSSAFFTAASRLRQPIHAAQTQRRGGMRARDGGCRDGKEGGGRGGRGGLEGHIFTGMSQTTLPRHIGGRHESTDEGARVGRGRGGGRGWGAGGPERRTPDEAYRSPGECAASGAMPWQAILSTTCASASAHMRALLAAPASCRSSPGSAPPVAARPLRAPPARRPEQQGRQRESLPLRTLQCR